MSDIVGVPYTRWRYYEGPNGIGGYTTQKDKDGWFWSFYCKPTGRGARAGKATRFEYVARKTSKRRSRKAAEERSYNLSVGLAVTDGVKKAKPKKDNPSGTGYCMRDKKAVIMQNPRTVEAKNGRTMIAGECPDCGMTLHKYGKIAHCPECDMLSEMAANDYICKRCRTTP